jgi:tRNA C32,U32 (ribose-2'-O)-methylase TrmJ
MLLCDIASSVPLKTTLPVLNLSHAVMLYAYHLSPLVLGDHHVPVPVASDSEYRVLKDILGKLLVRLDIPPGEGFYERVMERLGGLGIEDIHILHAIAKRVRGRLRE